MRYAGRLGLGLALFGCTLSVSAAPVGVVGGTADDPTDITANLIANEDIALTGGNYVVRLPQSGAGIVTVTSVDSALHSMRHNGFSTATNPAINYSGVISGNGTVRVTSAFDGQAPAYGQLFTGGALLFTGKAMQTWGVDGVASGKHNASAMTIDPNAMVGFLDSSRESATSASNVFETDAKTSRNITNNGYLYASRRNRWASITGNGVVVFAYNGGLGQLRGPQGSVYSAALMNFNSGAQLHWGLRIEDRPDGQPTVLESTDITVFVSHNFQFLTDPKTYKIGDEILSISQNIYTSALNHQLWNTGIVQMSGIMLPPAGSKNNLELAPVAEAVKTMYHYGTGSSQGFGRVVNLTNRPTLLMGDGRAIVTNPDGITNNTYYQGNPFNTLLSVSNFESQWSGYSGEAIAFNYSGQYRININLNANTTGSTVSKGAGIVTGIRNADWVNLLILNPNEWNAGATKPNHAILTVPAFLAGLVRIDKNAVLQLGDGTIGNEIESKTVTVNGSTITSRYNDSMGNGMVMTEGNDLLLPKGTGKDAMNDRVVFEIVNNGKLIVNNTPGALDATTVGASADVAAWVSANLLDGIKGSGSVEQRGTLALTLGAATGNPNSYTGGTLIAKGATLLAGSATAFGTHDATIAGSGDVVNNGTLKAATGLRIIAVPGNFTQATATTTTTAATSVRADRPVALALARPRRSRRLEEAA